MRTGWSSLGRFAPELLLPAVERSPQATAAHDRAGWIGIFTADGRVEDPVGSGVHIGHTQLGRFYDTFIGPRQIIYHRDFDGVMGTSVVRDLTLEIMMGSDVNLMVPTFIRYDLREDESGWRVASLRAYWELPVMVAEFLRSGMKSVSAAFRLSAALLRNQGLSGTARYVSGLRGPARRGKQLVAEAITQGRLGGDLQNRAWHKVIAAGNTVAASITTSSGRGVLFAELDDRGREILDVSVFETQ